MSDTELKGCPFCGVAPKHYESTFRRKRMTTIYCPNDDCAALSVKVKSAGGWANAVTRWNTRAPITPQSDPVSPKAEHDYRDWGELT